MLARFMLSIIIIFLGIQAHAAYPPVLTEVIPKEPSIVDTVVHGWVAKVVDGHTLAIQVRNGAVNIRIYGIESPDGAWGKKAKDFLQWRVERKDVALEVIGRDKHGRAMCRVYREGSDVGLQMVAMGLARAVTQSDPALVQTEAACKTRGIGMWGGKK